MKCYSEYYMLRGFLENSKLQSSENNEKTNKALYSDFKVLDAIFSFDFKNQFKNFFN